VRQTHGAPLAPSIIFADDCDVSDNESDVLEVEEVESESDKDLSGNRKRV